MGEKHTLSLSFDKDILGEFIQVTGVKTVGKLTNELENCMSRYIEENKLLSLEEKATCNEYTKELIWKCETKEEFSTIGDLLKYILRKLLESGVASEDVIEELQRASGNVPVRNFNLERSFYVNENFGTSYPLLLEHEKWKEYCKGGNPFSTEWFFIGDKKFHFCSAWVQRGEQRKKILVWIERNLKNWFEHADRRSIVEMTVWIKNL